MITGALTGFGRATAVAFAQDGATASPAPRTQVAGIPIQRVGVPEEFAQTILFLGATKAPFLTGQIVSVDDGKSAS